MLSRTAESLKLVKTALTFPHDDRAVIEIQVLDPQLQALADPHACFIQKLGEQTMLPLQKPEDALMRGT
jgi:hypothetical protein